MASHLEELARMVPAPDRVVSRPAKKFQHRLRPDEAEQLKADYRAGLLVKDLVAHYKVNQTTVNQHVRRAGVRLRSPKLSPKQTSEAANRYRSGLSLAAVSSQFGVDPDTIRRALVRAEVKIRDSQGRDRD
jgi:DNA-directed RNA polymerase specialized sigma24 family protein